MGWRKRERRLTLRIEQVRSRVKGNARALELQKTEYERRLSELNGEAGRLKAQQASSVSRELFDAKLDEIHRWQNTVNNRMAAWAGAGAVLAFLLNWFLGKL